MSTGYADFPLVRARGIRLLLMDVDGVLTDGSIVLTDAGEQLKAFNVRDGHGIKLLQRAGIRTAILTGRTSRVVEHRARELGIAHVVQGCLNKSEGLDMLLSMAELDAEACAYMGDDIVDMPAMRRCRLALAPRDAHPAVLRTAHWVSDFCGGRGAVRQAAEGLLLASGAWPEIIAAPYGADPADCGWPS